LVLGRRYRSIITLGLGRVSGVGDITGTCTSYQSIQRTTCRGVLEGGSYAPPAYVHPAVYVQEKIFGNIDTIQFSQLTKAKGTLHFIGVFSSIQFLSQSEIYGIVDNPEEIALSLLLYS